MVVARPRQLVLLLTAVAMFAVGWWWLRLEAAPPPLEPQPSPAPVAQATLDPGRVLPDAAVDHASVTTTRTPAAAAAPQLHGRLVQQGRPLANVPLRLHRRVDYMPVATDHTVTTAADGTFATAGLPTAFWLRADAASVPSDWDSPPQAPLTFDRDLGDLEPPMALALEVVVTDLVGQPVPHPRCWRSRSEVEVRLDGRDTRAPQLVVGDVHGRIRLERLMPGALHLKVSADGFAMVEKVLELDPDAAIAPLPVTLSRGQRLQGRVFDWRDQPLPGAIVSTEGRHVTTDATGAFAFDAYGGAEAIHVAAAGHQECWLSSRMGLRVDYSHIQLGRELTLRGIVRGGNARTTVLLDAAPDRPNGVPWPGPGEQLARQHAVAADGSFTIEGLAASDFVVHARAEGLGCSVGQRVAMREDLDIELTVEPQAAIELRIVDAEGRAIDPVEVVCDRQIVEYPSFFGPLGTHVQERVFDDQGRLELSAVGGSVRVPAAKDQPLALGVRSAGFLPEVRTFEAGQAPSELTIVLQRGGSVQGRVRSDGGRAYLLQLAIWPAAQDDAVRSRTAQPTLIDIDASGRFTSGTMPPGDYLAAIRRYGRGRIATPRYEHPGAVPLIDDGSDLRAVVQVPVLAGSTTTIELVEPALGTLRGRVRCGGRTIAGAWVVATRPDAERVAGQGRGGKAIDWDKDIHLAFVAGQRSGDDGSFRFLYRDAGPVEVRVRGADGAATMPPVVVVLPPPGDAVFCEVDIATGGVRGRFVGSAEDPERSCAAVLFPHEHAAADPFYSSPWAAPRVMSRKQCELGADGAFEFTQVPDGDWVVRVTDGWSTLFVQRLVTVRGGCVELGELRAADRVQATIAWRWAPDGPAPSVHGLWLFEAGSASARIWVGTHAATATGSQCSVAPGRYLGVVFGSANGGVDGLGLPPLSGFSGLSGSPLSKPFAFEVRSDGTCVPAEVELVREPEQAR